MFDDKKILIKPFHLIPNLLATVIAIVAALAFVSLTAQAQNATDKDIVPSVESGAEIYNTVCKGCHGVSIAPTLRGIINRPIASVDSFAGYSDGLKSKQSMVWSKENLDAFLTAPAEFAPGTLMIQVIPEAQKRADIIAFLGKLPPPR